MSHTYSKLYYHCVFRTKGNRLFLTAEVSEELNRYFVGIARQKDIFLIRVGGIEDHRHLLFELKPNQCVSDAMAALKANSSRWIRQKFPQMRDFGWQEGYSVFSVSASAKDTLIKYIDNQEEHHKKRTFDEELKLLLERHGIVLDRPE